MIFTDLLKKYLFKQQNMSDSGIIKMEFAAQIRGVGCVEAIKNALSGAGTVTIDADRGSVLIETSLPWLEIDKRIEATGRRVALTGFGGQSAVAMVEHGNESTNVRGVVRFCSLSNVAGQKGAVVDGTIDGLASNGSYQLNVHECGDISEGCRSVGDVYDSNKIISDASGRAMVRFINDRLDVSDLIGRSVVIAETDSAQHQHRLSCGIIARSAGIFENYKKICACDGTTIWDERNKSITVNKDR
ncbi:copper chaperone for superoxide dismutase-like [Anopheles marshallii]|uniref:copper chaperone for superoxide dismutase-like n=1 Tax=Anopheles marshallii TaxID=1521116 RepID=UPI00237B62D6|nr:copper chaperone for superoxide dismutase-like [Anopheles marshallii]XP_053664035.1 copper chaperone for superoxide dismutase-like [Anopheles marshallii]